MEREGQDIYKKLTISGNVKMKYILLQINNSTWVCFVSLTPHIDKLINALEQLQHKATRFVKSDCQWHSSISTMFADPKLEPLTSHQRKSHLSLFYKVVNCLVAISMDGHRHPQLLFTDQRTWTVSILSYFQDLTRFAAHFSTEQSETGLIPLNIIKANTICVIKKLLKLTSSM